MTNDIEQEVIELQESASLRYEADMRAIERWRAEKPTERDLTWPDHADMVVWLMDRLYEYEALAAGGEVSVERYWKDPVYHALVKRFRPTEDEIEAVCAEMSMASYGSQCVDAFERWAKKRWGVVGTNSHLRQDDEDA
jgi:hypothetical protein